jgi:multiple sugar transport system ATP-binding protein
VYNQPANKFVAGFVGAPPMNFMDGKIEGGKFVGNGLAFGLPAGHPALGHEGKKVTFGIRPEDIYDATHAAGVPVTHENSFEAKVDVLERLGAEDTAYLQAHGFNITASLDPDNRLAMGESHQFCIDLDKIHIFDGESEVAIR